MLFRSKHTLSASLAYAEWNQHKINIIDTPGIGNFLADARAALHVVDAAIVVVDAVAGALPGLSHPAAKAFIEAVGSAPMPKFGWTDVARFSGLGIPAVNFGPGSATLAHAPNEYVPLSHLHTCESALRTWLTS